MQSIYIYKPRLENLQLVNQCLLKTVLWEGDREIVSHYHYGAFEIVVLGEKYNNYNFLVNRKAPQTEYKTILAL